MAGPLFVGSVLAQAATRDGFDMRRHAASLLSNGDLGWVQTLTFLGTGIAVTSAALGLRLALREITGGPWVSRLVLVYGVSLLAAAAFPADPTLGFPVGTPETAGAVTGTGIAHMVSGMLGFASVITASLLVARAQLRRHETRRAPASAATGASFLLAMVGIMSGSGSASAGVTLGFFAAIALSFLWLASTCRWAGRVADEHTTVA